MNGLGAVPPPVLLAALALAGWSVRNASATLKDGKIDRTGVPCKRNERRLR